VSVHLARVALPNVVRVDTKRHLAAGKRLGRALEVQEAGTAPAIAAPPRFRNLGVPCASPFALGSPATSGRPGLCAPASRRGCPLPGAINFLPIRLYEARVCSGEPQHALESVNRAQKMCHVDDAIGLAALYHRPQQMFLWLKARGGSSTVQDARRTKAVHPLSEVVRSTSRANIFPRRWAESRRHSLVVLILILSDIVLALTMWEAASLLQSALGRGELSGIAVAIIVPNVVAWIGLRAVLGLYPGYGLDQVEELRRQTFAMVATLTIIAVFAFASQLAIELSRILLFGWALGLLLVAPLVRYVVKWMMKGTGLWGKPVVVLGAQEVGARVLKGLQDEWQLGLVPVGVFDNRPPEKNSVEGVPYAGTLTDALMMAQTYGLDTAIFAMPHTRRERLAKMVGLASTSFRYIVVMPNLGGITNSAVIARNFAGNFGVEIKHNLLFPWARRAKRILDLLLTAMGGLLISPLLIAIIVLIKLDSPGPALFVQERPGLNGTRFRIYKFRTMYFDAEHRFAKLSLENPALSEEFERHGKLREDPRVTRVGRWLRASSADELPQLWNVLKGNMSLVGPRPYLTSQTSQLGGTEGLIMRVAPGITGLWQVSGRSDVTLEQRVALDLYYVHNWSVWLDLVILARTVLTVVLSRGAY
jgi:Undecaprenyl-phosphate galactose phosphotransferase WbaP